MDWDDILGKALSALMDVLCWWPDRWDIEKIKQFFLRNR